MVQGVYKKVKLPVSVQKKQKRANNAAFTRKANAPIKAKKNKFSESKKIKDVISKSVNKAVEKEIRARAAESTVNLSKTQQATAQHLKNATCLRNAVPM
uniref:Uncharacterized protein n=1 Tax=Glossina palpalis gambiensis TaxID=67801 RepID=A0A1B0AU74_9MUSC